MRLGVEASLSALCSPELNYTGPDKRILGGLSFSGFGRLDCCSQAPHQPTAALGFDAGHM